MLNHTDDLSRLMGWEKAYIWCVNLLMPKEQESMDRTSRKQLQRFLAILIPFFPAYFILIFTSDAKVVRPLAILLFAILCAFAFSLRHQLLSVKFAQWLSAAVTFYVLPTAIIEYVDVFKFSYLEAFIQAAAVHPSVALLCFGGTVPGNLILCFDVILFGWCVSKSDLSNPAENQRCVVVFVNMALQMILGYFWIISEKVNDATVDRLLETATQANLLKTKFIAWLSHDLRTPLVGLEGFLDQLQETKLNEEQEMCTRNSRSCAKSIEALISNLLDLSMIESGKWTMKMELFNVSETVRFLENLARPIAKGLEINFDLKLLGGLREKKLVVWGDWLRLQQIVINLVTNACKYSQKGSSVSLTMAGMKSEQTLFMDIVVEDNGVGMTQEELSKVFLPFSEANNDDHSFSSNKKGIGLFIVSEIVKVLKGTIECKSNIGKGSSFAVAGLEFPLANPDQIRLWEQKSQLDEFDLKRENPTKKTSPTRTGNQEYKIPESAHILLAEDNLLNQQIFQRMLKLSGVNHYCVSNGEEAFQEWMKNPTKYSLILMDLEMPIMNGVDATRQIRKAEESFKIENKIPIVALTATTYQPELDAALVAGMNECISKPVEKRKLIDTIARVLSQ